MSSAFHGRLTDKDKDKDLLGKPVESKRNLEKKKVHPKPVFVRPAIQTRIRRATGIRTPRKEREREEGLLHLLLLLYDSHTARLFDSRENY